MSENKLTKQKIGELNALARQNLESAAGLLKGINFALDTRYILLNKRVTFRDENGKFRDAWAAAD